MATYVNNFALETKAKWKRVREAIRRENDSETNKADTPWSLKCMDLYTGDCSGRDKFRRYDYQNVGNVNEKIVREKYDLYTRMLV